MAYPHDGSPNLRPGATPDMHVVAPYFDPDRQLDELFAEFLDGSASIINDRTESNYRYDWTQFTGWLEVSDLPLTLGSVTKPNLVAFIAHLQRRPKKKGTGTLSSHSVHHYARVVRTFIRWCVGEGLYPVDPLAGGRRGVMPRLGPRLLKVAKKTDLERLLDGCDSTKGRTRVEQALRDRDRLIIALGADTGMRTGELCELQVGEIDHLDGWVMIHKSKWDRERRAPISRETMVAIRAYLRRTRPFLAHMPADAVADHDVLIVSRSGEALTPGGLYQALGRAYRRGGGTGRFGLHRLRHLFGTTGVERGMPSRISQAIMGHEDEKSQHAYQHPSDEAIKREHAKMTPLRDLSATRRRRIG